MVDRIKAFSISLLIGVLVGLIVLFASCKLPENYKSRSEMQDQIDQLQRQVVDVSARVEALDQCLFRKFPIIEDTFQLKMALMTCLTVARGK